LLAEEMIILDDRMFLNSGTVRACYHHPEDSRLVIKVPTGKRKEREKANLTEMKGYHELMREQTDLFCISHCYGFVSTNRGKGLVCDCIRDDRGSVSKTIWDLIISQDDSDGKYILEVAKNFCDMLISKKIFIFDLNVKNIAFKLRYDGTYKPFVIDLKGRSENKEFIPYSRYIKFFSERKMERRSNQLIERISRCLDRRAELQFEHGTDL